MTKEPKVVNPFYILLMIAGVIFALTACAYFVMALRMRAPGPAELDETAPLTLVTFLDRHGVTVMLVELAVLAVTTFAAIGTDGFWTRRATAKAQRQEKSVEDT